MCARAVFEIVSSLTGSQVTYSSPGWLTRTLSGTSIGDEWFVFKSRRNRRLFVSCTYFRLFLICCGMSDRSDDCDVRISN